MDDLVFKGSMPAFYDRYLQPALGGAYVPETVMRVKALAPRRLLETACGTGAVTYAIADAMPGIEIVATDISEAMIDFAKGKRPGGDIVWHQADAQRLAFPDASFDVVVCQLGVMFFPDKVQGMREARRVLRPGGRFLFTVWDSLDRNELQRLCAEAVAGMFPDDPPTYTRRIPFGYHDHAVIAAQLRDAGFTDVQIDTVRKTHAPESARDFAIGTCQGGGLRGEIEKRDPGALERATDVVTQALERRFGSGPIRSEGQVLMVAATVMK
jgi:ubiquinone/menaquinone biosynthesis C-methylase UbiE